MRPSKSRSVRVRRAQPLLGTFLEIETESRTERIAQAGIDAAFSVVARVHALMSRQLVGSDVHAVNAAPTGRSVRVDPWTLRVVRAGLRISQATGGRFDMVERVAERHAAGAPCWLDVSVGDTAICKTRPLRISLDGIAKGFAVDQAVRVLRRAGVMAGLVNAGGDLRCFGDREYEIAIRAPRAHHPAPVARIVIRDCALASSSSAYGARFWGGAVVTADVGVTVLARSALVADALTKAVDNDQSVTRSLLRRYRASAWCVHVDTAVPVGLAGAPP